MDTVSPETRHRMMSAIRGSNTKPERQVRSALFALGFRFRLNCPDLPGRPDMKLTKHRAVILVNGCFWHGHGCRFFRPPASNVAFWIDKIARNRARDLRNLQDLRAAGWRVCIVWECLVRSAAFRAEPAKIVGALARWIEGRKPFLELFDADAVASDRPGSQQRRRGAFGSNRDAGRYAAERSPGYGSRDSVR